MLTLLHISDLHFGPPYLPEIGRAVQTAARDLEPDVVVASGDFTQRARPEQFREARTFLDRFHPLPVVVVPGNHDVPLYRMWERLRDPYREYRRHISEKLDTVARHDDAVIVALNSTAPRRALTNGRIRRTQLDFAESAFRAAPPHAARVVVAHHHFAPAPDYQGGQVMPKAKRAIDLFAELRVDLILGGHMHRAYIGNSLDVYSGADREHGIIIAQSGTTTSRRGRAREREKNSFNLVRIGDEVIRISHYMYFDDAQAFAPISRHIFPRAERQYFGAHPGENGGAAEPQPSGSAAEG